MHCDSGPASPTLVGGFRAPFNTPSQVNGGDPLAGVNVVDESFPHFELPHFELDGDKEVVGPEVTGRLVQKFKHDHHRTSQSAINEQNIVLHQVQQRLAALASDQVGVVAQENIKANILGKPEKSVSGSNGSSVNARLTELQLRNEQLQRNYVNERAALEEQFQAKFDVVFKQRAATLREAAVPGTFWLDIMLKHPRTCALVHDADHDALSYLLDIRCGPLQHGQKLESCSSPELGFWLEFEFSKDNPYFSNQVLSKEFWVQDFYGPCSRRMLPIQATKGTSIDWRSDQVNLRLGSVPGENKETFFNFFDQVYPHLDDAETADQHFAGALVFFETLVPDAYKWYSDDSFVASQLQLEKVGRRRVLCAGKAATAKNKPRRKSTYDACAQQ